MRLTVIMAAVRKGTSGLLERVPSAGPGIRNKHKGAPARIHPNSSPIYKTQSESALTTGFRNLSVKDDKTIPKRSTSSRSGSNGVKCLADAAALLQSESVKNVVLVAGAGISTPSGIPDFRSPGTGLYDNLQQYQIPYPEAIFDIEYFHMNPRPFFTLAKELYPSGKYRPNYIHYFARLLHDKGLLLRMYTQNIDGLERLAGLPAEKLVEAHGTFATATCTICQQKLPGSDIKEKIYADKLPRCPSRGCVGIVKPDIVFFGEDLPRKFYSYMKDMLQTDMVIVMGTSLEVQPFAGIIDTVRWTVPRVLFNREAVGPFKYSRRAQDVVSPGDLIDNMVKFSTMTGWKEDMVELITKEEGEFKIINNPPPPPPKNPNQRRNYSNIANRPRAVFYSDDSSTEESTDSESDVTSSDSSDEEVNRIRKFKGVNRPKFGNNSVKNGANNSIIRNGFRSSSAKIGDRNSRNIHTESTGTSKPSPTINGSLTGRSVKSDSGLNKYDGKRRVDRNTSNGAQNESIGNKNISVTEKNKVLRKYGLSPGPNGGQNGSNLLQDMQKPVRKNLKNSRIDIENRKPKVGFVQKRTVETEITDKSLVQPVSDNAIKNEIIDKEVIDKEGLMKTPSSVGSPKVEALNILEPGENIDNANGDTIDGKSSKIEMGIRREAPIFGLNKEQSIVSGDFTDDNAAQTLVNKGKDSSIDKSSEVPKSESKTSVISQGTSESEVDIDCIENTALNRKEDRSPKQQFDNDLFDRRDAYSVSEISNEKTSKDLSRRAAKSFAKYANLQSQRRVAGHGKPHRKSVKDKPPTGKKIPKPSSELSKLNTRPYGYAYRQRGQVKGVGPFHRMNVRTLSSSIDFTQETRAGSAELPKISYRHNVQAVKTVDRTVYGASPACEYHID